MNLFFYYLDKLTSWLDFSWLLRHPKKPEVNTPEWYEYETSGYLDNLIR
jgi:hypothetical protein